MEYILGFLVGGIIGFVAGGIVGAVVGAIIVVIALNVGLANADKEKIDDFVDSIRK